MTANQIAYRQTVLEEERNAADKANQERVAAENERHNNAVEAINTTSNDIDKYKAEEVARHNRAMEEIQNEYNDKYLELQKATNEERLEIEQQLANIKAREQDEVTRHNKASEDFTQQSLAITKQQQDEVARHNKEMESLESSLNDIKSEQNWLKAQESLMNASYQNGMMSNEYAKRQIDLINANNNYSLGLMNMQARNAQLQIEAAKAQAELEKSQSETVRNYLSAGADVLRSIGTSIMSGLTAFRAYDMPQPRQGVDYGKKKTQ